jgi:hypothetical protein
VERELREKDLEKARSDILAERELREKDLEKARADILAERELRESEVARVAAATEAAVEVRTAPSADCCGSSRPQYHVGLPSVLHSASFLYPLISEEVCDSGVQPRFRSLA